MVLYIQEKIFTVDTLSRHPRAVFSFSGSNRLNLPLEATLLTACNHLKSY